MTMEPFPEQHDLIALFECEPLLTDKGVPWSYNHLTFTTTRGHDRIVCEIEPGYHTLKFEWSKSDERLVSLDLNWVAGITTDIQGQTEAMIVTFRDKKLMPLRIQLKPHVSISWGTNIEPA